MTKVKGVTLSGIFPKRTKGTLLGHTLGPGVKPLSRSEPTSHQPYCIYGSDINPLLSNHFGNHLSPILTHCLDGAVLPPMAAPASLATSEIESAVGM